MRVTHTFGSSVGHHNLMQVVGAHTRGTQKTKGVIQLCNCTSSGYTIVEHIPAHIKRQQCPPTMKKKKIRGARSVWTIMCLVRTSDVLQIEDKIIIVLSVICSCAHF